MILTGRSVRTGASLRHLVAIKAQDGRVGRTNSERDNHLHVENLHTHQEGQIFEFKITICNAM